MLALGGELRGAHSYKSMTVMDVPVLLDTRTRTARSVRSSISAAIAEPSSCPRAPARARRFACPYHNWTYDTGGDLVGVTDREFFGDVDTSCLGLTPLSVAERAGLIFVVLTPGTPMDIDEHLCGYDQVLDFFGFGDWHLVSRTEIPGPNWKIAYDGYLDFYHLPFLHRKTFGPDISNKSLYYEWGPHQRMTSPDPGLLALDEVPEDEWNLDRMCGGVWTIFPHVSFAGGHKGGLFSQLFPGDSARSLDDDPELLRRDRTVRRGTRSRAGRRRLPRTGRPRGGLLHRPPRAAGAWRREPRSTCCSGATKAAGSGSTPCWISCSTTPPPRRTPRRAT